MRADRDGRAVGAHTCDGYTCAKWGCEQNPGFRLPCPERGPVIEIFPDVSGSFWGYIIRAWTAEEQAERERVSQIPALSVPTLSQYFEKANSHG